ncbi:UDP-4-amino-4-deoxy-L-arabinose--oxoglutarate aminotransferase [uncultured archaeon]|nr:UDP-4-amino-4-deoxy-L-arabinose--oxoglutarate aminotransferase [uncultured archaeon]
MISLFKVNMSPDAPALVAEVLNSGYVGQGPKVLQFEKLLDEYFKSRVLTVSSCTHGLDLIYHLSGLGAGDKVISSPLTCLATNTGLVNRGVEILWADVDPDTGCIDANDVEDLLCKHKKVRAIQVVDWGGRECSEDALEAISREYGVPIIEDAAHVFKPKTQRHACLWYTAFSFGPIKHLCCGGDGGAIIVPPFEYERAKLLRWYGLDRSKFESMRCGQDLLESGYRYNMSDIAATIGIANMERGKMSVQRATEHAKIYKEAFCDLKTVKTPEHEDDDNSWWLYDIRTPRRDLFEKFMAARSIAVSQVHRRNDVMSSMPKSVYRLHELDRYEAEHCCIPVGWWLDQDEIIQVTEAVRDWDKNL